MTSNADYIFHQFKIKDDELLPYTEENDFINGTLFTHEHILDIMLQKLETSIFFQDGYFGRKYASHSEKRTTYVQVKSRKMPKGTS